MERCYAWIKEDPIGIEQAVLNAEKGSTRIDSFAIGSAPLPYRVHFLLELDENWVTRSLEISSQGDGWKRHLELNRSATGIWVGESDGTGELPWIEQGVEPTALPAHVLDVDVQYSPATNLMPVKRLGLNQTGRRETFTMAWISVPHLETYEDVQTYTILNGDDSRLVGFESGDGSFKATIECDDDGVVIDYPKVGRRLDSRSHH